MSVDEGDRIVDAVTSEEETSEEEAAVGERPEIPPQSGPVPPHQPLPMILGKRRSIVATALLFTLGAGSAYVALLAFDQLRSVVIMLGLALLIALTLEPLVSALHKHRVPRWLAAIVAWLLAVVVLTAPVVLAVDATSAQLPTLIKSVPNLIAAAESHLGGLGNRLRSITNGSSGPSSSSVTPQNVLTYVLQGGQLIFSAFADTAIVAVLSLWILIALPRLTETFYRVVPRSRRDGVESITSEVLSQVSRFMLANVLTSVLAGAATWLWALSWGIPYSVLLGSLVAVLDLIPTVGSTIGGIVVSVVALTVGLPVAIGTAVFYIAFRLIEDYIIQPRAMRYSVELPGVITVPAVLVGGAVLGIPGALFAVPVALVARVLIARIALPALDRR
jgi:predicted PurR-regulated permease PerM